MQKVILESVGEEMQNLSKWWGYGRRGIGQLLVKVFVWDKEVSAKAAA